jgi:hypothetical protein
MAHEIQMATAAGWQHELRQLVTDTLLCSTVMRRLVVQPGDAAGVGDAILQLLRRRALSLQQHAEPPRCLAACLVDSPDGEAAISVAAEELEPQHSRALAAEGEGMRWCKLWEQSLCR